MRAKAKGSPKAKAKGSPKAKAKAKGKPKAKAKGKPKAMAVATAEAEEVPAAAEGSIAKPKCEPKAKAKGAPKAKAVATAEEEEVEHLEQEPADADAFPRPKQTFAARYQGKSPEAAAHWERMHNAFFGVWISGLGVPRCKELYKT